MKNKSLNGSVPNGDAKPNLYIQSVDDVNFVTDGSYKCPEVKGRYTISVFSNPSGKLVPCLKGNRPIEAVPQPVNCQPGGSGNEVKNGSPRSIRYRKNFRTLKEAAGQRDYLINEDAGCERRNHMVETSLTLDQVKDAEIAFSGLIHLPLPDWTDTGWNLVKTVDYIMKHFKPCRNPKPLPEAVAAYIAHKDKDCNRASATLDTLDLVLRRLVAACPGKCVHQVTEAELRPLIRRGTQVKSMRRPKSAYSNFFKWCAGRERSWTPYNPAAEVELPDRTDDNKVPQILPVSAVREILKSALKFKGGKLFLFCAVAFGCALRPSEMGRIQARRKRLGTASFHFGKTPQENYIYSIGKGRRRRNVVIPREFVPLIRTFVEAGYPLIPRNFAADWTHLRATIGYLGSKGNLPDYFDPAKLIPWVDDYPRHTGGSHHFNRSEDEFKTSKWMGNSPKMLFTHYDGRPTPADTAEFYRIPSELTLPTVAELQTAGVPEEATDADLEKLKCDLNRHTTFDLSKTEFDSARAAYLVKNPAAAVAEPKGFTRGKGMWTKRRMLDLPPRDELLKLFWTFTLEDLAAKFKVTRATMARVAEDHNIQLPGKGNWQQRAAGMIVENIPDEVARLFPDGLPKYAAPVGRTAINLPPPAALFRLLWEHRLTDPVSRLNCSARTLERAIKRFNLSKPGHSYWHAKPETRIIPDRIKHLLALDSAQLEIELAKNMPLPPVDL